VLLFLNRAKQADRRGRIMLINASGEFVKGKPKNQIPDAGIRRIADTFLQWAEAEKLSRVISTDEAKATDYNLSPSRYIDLGDSTDHRPIQDILDQLASAEAKAQSLSRELATIFTHVGYRVGEQH
jgi:type I restriction enzyme M protein